MQRDTLGVRRNEEQRNTVFVACRAAFAGRDDEHVGVFSVDHNSLATVQHHVVAIDLGRGGHLVQVIAAGGFAMGKGHLQRAADHLFDVGLLVVVAQIGNQTAAQNGRIKERFDHACAAQFLEHNCDVETSAAKAALIFGEQCANDPQFGQTVPDIRGKTGVALEDFVTRCRVVFVAQETAQTVLQHLAFFCQVEVHAPPPIVVLAMIWRWISFEPPKIDSLRLLKYCAATGPAFNGSGSARFDPSIASDANGIA